MDNYFLSLCFSASSIMCKLQWIMDVRMHNNKTQCKMWTHGYRTVIARDRLMIKKIMYKNGQLQEKNARNVIAMRA